MVGCSKEPATTPADLSAPPESADLAGQACAVPACAAYDSPEPARTVAELAIGELSGLAASHLHPGVLYTHNDSGDEARFFAMDVGGAALGEFRLTGATAVDWEDVAVGPCPQGSCVYLADVGDNPLVRQGYVVYRVAEPAVSAAGSVGVVTVEWERLPFRYPDGAARNSETLLVHPLSGEVYVVTKRGIGLPSEVYRLPMPLTPEVEVSLVKVADLPVPEVSDLPLTGGDIHPCGASVLLRMYGRAVRLDVPSGQPFEAAFTATPVTVPTAGELQGEAIAWSSDGRAYYTASEGTAPLLSVVRCADGS